MARVRPAKIMRGRSASGADGVLRFRNRLFTVMRGPSINQFGDETDVGEVYLQHIPAALAEESHETFDRASQTRRTIRSFTCVFDAWVDVTMDDTLMDESTGYFFLVEDLMERPGIGLYPPQKILTLRMRSGISAGSDA